jgi:ribosome-associated protein
MSDDYDDYDEGPSKSQRKRDASALQALGEELAELPAGTLDKMALPDRLRQALDDLPRITAHEARRRHCQFIGKLMRNVDPEPLQAAIDSFRRPTRDAARVFRVTEKWRDRLVAEGEPALRAFEAAYPGADAEALAETAAAARDGRSGAPKRLFRMVKAWVEQDGSTGGAPGGATLVE